jgi:stage V sporulation protein D (sporulation-specific penicillin-binding protein)
MVAAPVFKRIAEQVLPYLDVPRDVPLSPKLIQASYNRRELRDPSSLEELAPVDFSAQTDLLPDGAVNVKEREPQAKTPEVVISADEGGDIPVPDFSGKTVREATDLCLRLGLDPVLIGSSRALNQVPAAGVKVRRGAKITVQFGIAPAEQHVKSRAAIRK